jgi:hypothetical protein
MIAVRQRAAAVVSTILAIAAATLAVPAAASAVVPGVTVEITRLPDTFAAGDGPRRVTVVASADESRQCQNIRWSLLVRVAGVTLDQVRIERVPEPGGSPLRVRSDGDTARITDVRFDPRALCPGRTVTAQYEVAFTGDRSGQITFKGQAFDAAGRLLQSATGTSRVVGEGDEGDEAAEPSPTEAAPTESADPSPSTSESDDAGAAAAGDDETSAPAAPPPGGDITANRAAASGGIPSLLGPGLVVGAVFVFVGLGLLLRIRMRKKPPKVNQHPLPTSFYPAP